MADIDNDEKRRPPFRNRQSFCVLFGLAARCQHGFIPTMGSAYRRASAHPRGARWRAGQQKIVTRLRSRGKRRGIAPLLRFENKMRPPVQVNAPVRHRAIKIFKLNCLLKDICVQALISPRRLRPRDAKKIAELRQE